MFSRRAVLSAGAAALVAGGGTVAAQWAGVLDDALRGAGVKPHPEPDPSDVRMLARASEDAQSLLGRLSAAMEARDVSQDDRRFLAAAQAVVREQARAVGAAPTATGVGADTSVDGLAALVAAIADDRARDALRAASPEVAQVLGSMAAGLDQLVESRKRST